MDPPPIMNSHGGGYRSSDNAYNLAEIWPFNFGQFNDTNREDDDDDDDAMVVDHRKRSQDDDDDSALAVSTTTAPNGKSDSDSKRLKLSKSRDKNLVSKVEREANSGKQTEQSTKASEPPKQDYIHVRARRGQATDSHSLAERAGRSSLTAFNSSIRSMIGKTSPDEQARREKISERMKILQDLVPGCNKVIGKALVLDEIINYIQSLQRQVEFLSMKLEAVNSRANPSIEGFPSKDFGQQTFDIAGVSFGSQAPREFSRGSSPEWLHMQIGGNFERST